MLLQWQRTTSSREWFFVQLVHLNTLSKSLIMNTEDKNLPIDDNEMPIADGANQLDDQVKPDAISSLEEDIIRNDTIPETSRDTPGSNGAFPVGAFENSKD
jgi:hypothetical protein